MSSTEAIVAKRAFKQVRITAFVCAVAFGGTAAASALSYVASFPTAASRHQLLITTRNATGLSVLLGPISTIDTVGGYTAYKVFVFLTTVGAIWALLAATRLLRGEEDAGRWQLVMAGGTRPGRATAATLAALGAAVGVIFAGTVLLTLLADRHPGVGFGVGGSVLFGLSITMPAAVFVGIGAVMSQLCRTRRAANGLGMAAFGITFVVRMVADAGPSTRWLLWATPFGWSELMRPLTRNDAWPLVPAAVTVLALGTIAVALATRRDLGSGVLASRDVATQRLFGLGSAFGMTARLELPVLIAWCAGAAAAGVVYGMIAKLTTTGAPGSFGDTLRKFGVRGSFAKQYFGVVFLLVATLVGLLPAGQIGAASAEETSGRLVHVLTRATRRSAWIAGRLALTGAAVVAAALLSGLGTWIGAGSQGIHLGFATMLGAGLNVVPTALVALGVGAVVLSIAPRAAATSVYGVVIWSLLVDLFASLVSSLKWLEHLGLFHYMALAPAQPTHPETLAITTAAAVALCGVATALFCRRDLQSA